MTSDSFSDLEIALAESCDRAHVRRRKEKVAEEWARVVNSQCGRCGNTIGSGTLIGRDPASGLYCHAECVGALRRSS